MNKYAFFIDIDGTYLSSKGKIINENVNAINKLVSMGHYVFICTGRALTCLNNYIIESANWSGIISSSGAVITIKDKLLRHFSVENEFILKVLEGFIREKRWIVLGSHLTSYAYAMYDEPEKWEKIYSSKELENLTLEISKLDMDVEMSKKLTELIEEEMNIYYHSTFAEAVIKGVSKASAVEHILSELGIKREYSVAIGDSVNDLNMLEYAAIGIAMGNSPENVKKMADEITDTNDNAGLSKALSKFF